MFWFLFFCVLYLASLATVLTFIYSAGVLNSRADRNTEKLISHLHRVHYREAA